MSTRNDYTADEWRAISTAPSAAGLVIALSDVGACITAADGPVVIDRAMTRTPFGDVPEIVKVLVDAAKRHDGQPEVPEIGAADRAGTTKTLIASVRTAVRAVEAQSPAEAEPFKAWLASVAAKVLQAAKVAAAPDPGATPVTPAEQYVINRLADVLAARDSGPVGSRTHSTPAITSLAASVRVGPANG